MVFSLQAYRPSRIEPANAPAERSALADRSSALFGVPASCEVDVIDLMGSDRLVDRRAESRERPPLRF